MATLCVNARSDVKKNFFWTALSNNWLDKPANQVWVDQQWVEVHKVSEFAKLLQAFAINLDVNPTLWA